MKENWEVVLDQPTFAARRSGRFLVVELKGAHRVLSSSVRNGGFTDHLQFLVNHQSCEGAAHVERHKTITDSGPEGYHDLTCGELALPADATALMGTAANMNYCAIAEERDGNVSVAAMVTAGVAGNATTAGEPATWRETASGSEKLIPYAGTINTILLVNQPLTVPALTRAVVTMTEGKTAALMRLAVPSKLGIDLATGTGTDQFCLASPLHGEFTLTSSSPHMKLGEMIGLATRRATQEALRWQNGLEPSYTRGVFHALGRYGVHEASIFDDLTPLLEPSDLELLKKNSKAAFYEPLVGAAAHALAGVADRLRYGMLPESVGPQALAQQGAILAASLAAKVHLVARFHNELRQTGSTDVKGIAVRAIALGWAEKWRSGGD